MRSSSLLLGASLALTALAFPFAVEDRAIKAVVPSICVRDECFLALVDPRVLAAASSFCVAYITPTVTATVTATATTRQTTSALLRQTSMLSLTDYITSTVTDSVTSTATATVTSTVTAGVLARQELPRNAVPGPVIAVIVDIFGAARVSSVCSCLVTATTTKTVLATRSITATATATILSTIRTIATIQTTQDTVQTLTADSLVTTTATVVATTTPVVTTPVIPNCGTGIEQHDLPSTAYCDYAYTDLTVQASGTMYAKDCLSFCTGNYYSYITYIFASESCTCYYNPGEMGGGTGQLVPLPFDSGVSFGP